MIVKLHIVKASKAQQKLNQSLGVLAKQLRTEKTASNVFAGIAIGGIGGN